MATVGFIFATSSGFGEIVLNGVMVNEGQRSFSLSSTEDKTNKWISVGQTFAGYTAVAFDPATGVLTIEKNQVQTALQLQAATVKDSGPAEAAKAKLRNLTGLELAYELVKQGDPKPYDVLTQRGHNTLKIALSNYEAILGRLNETEATAKAPGASDAEKTATNSAVIFLRNRAADQRLQVEKAAAEQAARLLAQPKT